MNRAPQLRLSLEHELIVDQFAGGGGASLGTEKDCRFWAESEDRQAAWIPRPLYTHPDERVARLEGLLKTALARLALKGDDADDLRAALEGK